MTREQAIAEIKALNAEMNLEGAEVPEEFIAEWLRIDENSEARKVQIPFRLA